MNKRGVIKNYKSSFITDFVGIKPHSTPTGISKKLINKLNYCKYIDILKSTFPPNSRTINGFGVKKLTDISYDVAISVIKNNLIG